LSFNYQKPSRLSSAFLHATLQKPNLMLTGALALHPAGQHGRYQAQRLPSLNHDPMNLLEDCIFKPTTLNWKKQEA
jgi:hypothetical protein